MGGEHYPTLLFSNTHRNGTFSPKM